MAQNRVRPVGLFEGGHFFRAELDIDRLKDFLEMMRALVAPMMGATTPGAWSTQAQAICVGDTPRSWATFPTAAATSSSLSLKYIRRVIGSVCARLVGPSPSTFVRLPAK